MSDQKEEGLRSEIRRERGESGGWIEELLMLCCAVATVGRRHCDIIR